MSDQAVRSEKIIVVENMDEAVFVSNFVAPATLRNDAL